MVELQWDNFQEVYKQSLVQECEAEHTSIHDEFLIPLESNAENDLLKKNAIVYYAGYCAFKKISCHECRIKLLKENDEIPTSADTFIFEKNFKKSSNYGSLKAPTSEYNEVAHTSLAIFEETFKNDRHLSNICVKATDRCINIIERDFPGFMPLKDDSCYGHLKIL